MRYERDTLSWITLTLKLKFIAALVLTSTSLVAQRPPMEILNGDLAAIEGGRLVSVQRESLLGADLNGDGDTEDRIIQIRNLETAEITNIPLAVVLRDGHDFDGLLDISADWLLFPVSEAEQGGVDLNDDADTNDVVVHVHHLATGVTANLRLALGRLRAGDLKRGVAGNRLLLEVSEGAQGAADLNGDGDTGDTVYHVVELSTGGITNVELASGHVSESRLPYVSGNGALVLVSESDQGLDLDGDGRTNSKVLHVVDLSNGRTSNTRLRGPDRDDPWANHFFGNWAVLVRGSTWRVIDLSHGTTTNLMLAPRVGVDDDRDSVLLTKVFFHSVFFVFDVWETRQGMDLNGDGDTEDTVWHIHNMETGETENLGLATHTWDSFARDARLGVLDASEDWLVLEGELGPLRRSVWHVYNTVTGETMDFGLTANVNGDRLDGVRHAHGSLIHARGDWLLFRRRQAGRDVVHVHEVSTGETTNLRLVGSIAPVGSGHWLTGSLSESQKGEDLNGDGDSEDEILHVHSLSMDETTNLEVVSAGVSVVSSDWLLVAVEESVEGEDFNRDGDIEDLALLLHRLSTGETTPLGYVVAGPVFVSGDWLVMDVSESLEGEDLNGDGDTVDSVLHVRNLETGDTMNLGLSGTTGPEFASDRWLAIEVSESAQSKDLNGDGDIVDTVLHLVDLDGKPVLPPFLRGDCNGDGEVIGQVSDAVFLLRYNFFGAEEPPCLGACDANGDGEVRGQVTDALYLLNFNFRKGPPPVAPFPDCSAGSLDTDDGLGCVTKPKNCQQ